MEWGVGVRREGGEGRGGEGMGEGMGGREESGGRRGKGRGGREERGGRKKLIVHTFTL